MIFGKKIALAGGVLLVACWPFASGQIAQMQIEHQLAQLQSDYFSVENSQYERGYLSSAIETTFTVKEKLRQDFILEGLPTSFTVKTDLSHGFLSVNGHSSLVMSEDVKMVTRHLWSEKGSPFYLKFSASVLGELRFDGQLIAMQGKLKEINVESALATFSGVFDKNKEILFQLDMPVLHLSNDSDEKMSFNHISMHANGKMDENIWIGKQQIKIAKSEIKNNKNDLYSFDEFSFSNINEIVNSQKESKSKKIDAMSVLQFSNLASESQVVEQFKLGINLNGIDYNALNTIAKMTEDQGYVVNQDELSSVLTSFDLLIENGVNFTVMPLELTLPDGEMKGHIELEIKEGVAQASQQIPSLVNHLKGDVDIRISNSLLDMFPVLKSKVMNLKSNGIVLDEGNGVVIKASFAGDTVTNASGNNLPLMQVLFSLM